MRLKKKMLFKSMFIIYLMMIQFNSSIKSNDFCYLNQIIGHGLMCNYYKCGFDLYVLLNINHVAILTNGICLKIFFFDNIKNCKPNEYISLYKQVCSILKKLAYFMN